MLAASHMPHRQLLAELEADSQLAVALKVVLVVLLPASVLNEVRSPNDSFDALRGRLLGRCFSISTRSKMAYHSSPTAMLLL